MCFVVHLFTNKRISFKFAILFAIRYSCYFANSKLYGVFEWQFSRNRPLFEWSSNEVDKKVTNIFWSLNWLKNNEMDIK